MIHSKVYQKLNFLLHLKDASVPERQNMLSNLTQGQVEAIREVAMRVVNGVINPMRRDVEAFQRKRLVLRSLASSRVSHRRKKTTIQRHHTMIPALLRTRYLIRTIIDEIRTAREA